MKTNKQRGAANRRKGHGLERLVVELLRADGYEATTARYSSREQDDLGCDVVTNAPLSIQCKNSERLSVPAHDLLKQMESNGLNNPAVIHKRNAKGLVITLRVSDLLGLIKYQGDTGKKSH